MSASQDVDALVVGAGIAGLAAARELESRGADVLLVEAEDQPGGVMRTDEVAGYRIERGPSSLLLRAPLLRGLERLGLADALERAAPASRSRWLLREGQLIEVPLGPLDLMRTPLLSGAAKRRLLREPFVAQGDGRDETVAEFVTRRLGGALVDALVGPFLTGVYAGDERQLGAEAVFPSLVRAEREHGSLTAGLLASALRRRDRGRAGTFSWPGGLGSLATVLAAGLRSEPRYATAVRRIEPCDAGFRVGVDSPDGSEEWSVRRLVLATPSAVASDLVRGIDAEAADWIDSIDYAPVATVGLGAGPDALRRQAPGFGFLVPRGEGRGLLGCLFMSELFRDRAPPGRQLLQCMLGGVRDPGVVDLDDSQLVALAIEELDAPLGVAEPLDALRVRRWTRAVAQPKPGHAAGLRAARARLAARGPLAIAGGYTDGVSIADSFASGVAAGERLAPVG